MEEISFIFFRGKINVILKALATGLIGLGLNASALESTNNYVQINRDYAVYTEHFAARPGRPTVVLVNGLVYDLKRWDRYTQRLVEAGVGVVRYNFRGQSKTLLREIEQHQTPKFFEAGLSPEDFSRELSVILRKLGIREKVTMVD